jgi:hypothetical protein
MLESELCALGPRVTQIGLVRKGKGEGGFVSMSDGKGRVGGMRRVSKRSLRCGRKGGWMYRRWLGTRLVVGVFLLFACATWLWFHSMGKGHGEGEYRGSRVPPPSVPAPLEVRLQA